jgi:GDP-L-fucose synthase
MIIHLAAKVGGNFANTAYPVEFLRDNLAIDQNVLGLAKEFSVTSHPEEIFDKNEN